EAATAAEGRKGIRIPAEANRQVVQRYCEDRRILREEREDLVDREDTTTDSPLNDRAALAAAIDRHWPGHIQVAIGGGVGDGRARKRVGAGRERNRIRPGRRIGGNNRLA